MPVICSAASSRERARARGERSWLCARRRFNESLWKDGDLSGNVGVAGINGLFPAPLAHHSRCVRSLVRDAFAVAGCVLSVSGVTVSLFVLLFCFPLQWFS